MSRKQRIVETANRRTKSGRAAQASLLARSIQDDVQAQAEPRALSRKTIVFNPANAKQESMVEAIEQNPVTVAMGPAGVGKTFVAAAIAAKMLYAKEVDKIILTRSNVKVGDDIGMLPGTIEEKMAPLLAPILSALERQMGAGDYNYSLAKGKIQMLPFEYVRGRSFKDAFVIVDEAQNMTPKDIQALCTRYESGRTVLLGDPFQHDLEDVEPGVTWLSKFAKRHRLGVPVIEFGLSEIVRSGFVKKFLMALYKDAAKQQSAK